MNKSIKYYIIGQIASLGIISFLWYLSGVPFERSESLAITGGITIMVGIFIGFTFAMNQYKTKD